MPRYGVTNRSAQTPHPAPYPLLPAYLYLSLPVLHSHPGSGFSPAGLLTRLVNVDISTPRFACDATLLPYPTYRCFTVTHLVGQLFLVHLPCRLHDIQLQLDCGGCYASWFVYTRTPHALRALRRAHTHTRYTRYTPRTHALRLPRAFRCHIPLLFTVDYHALRLRTTHAFTVCSRTFTGYTTLPRWPRLPHPTRTRTHTRSAHTTHNATYIVVRGWCRTHTFILVPHTRTFICPEFTRLNLLVSYTHTRVHTPPQHIPHVVAPPYPYYGCLGLLPLPAVAIPPLRCGLYTTLRYTRTLRTHFTHGYFVPTHTQHTVTLPLHTHSWFPVLGCDTFTLHTRHAIRVTFAWFHYPYHTAQFRYHPTRVLLRATVYYPTAPTAYAPLRLTTYRARR